MPVQLPCRTRGHTAADLELCSQRSRPRVYLHVFIHRSNTEKFSSLVKSFVIIKQFSSQLELNSSLETPELPSKMTDINVRSQAVAAVRSLKRYIYLLVWSFEIVGLITNLKSSFASLIFLIVVLG